MKVFRIILFASIYILMAVAANAQVKGTVTSGTVLIDTTGFNIRNGRDGVDGKDAVISEEMIKKLMSSVLLNKNLGCVAHIYTAADIDSAMKGVVEGKITKLEFMQTDIIKNISIPKTWGGTSKFLIIEGNGANLKGWIKQDKPISQAEAEDAMTQYKIIIQNLSFEAPGDTCIITYASYNNEISNNRFRRAKQAVYLGFNMNAVVYHNDAVNMTGTAFEADRLYVTGANNTNSQSNNASFIHNRVFNANGAYASFSSKAANNVDFFKNTLEGGTPQFGIITDDQGSTTVKMVSKSKNHFELTCAVAAMQDKLNDGITENHMNWNQKPSPVLLNVISTAGCIVSFSGQPNLLATDKFQSSSSVKWSFLNNKRFDNATIWKDVVPTQIDNRYFYQGGSRWDNTNGQLNGKKILTQP